MSYPHLDITISAYKMLRSGSQTRLKQMQLAGSPENNDETQLLSARIVILDELINAATEVRGLIDHVINNG
jgi:hypothetical protein